MKVDYTLPAMQVGTLPELPDAPPGAEAGASFREQLRTLAVSIPPGWEQQLGLNARPFTAAYIGPPPRPHTLQLFDPETERSRWHSMLWRHSRVQESSNDLVAGGKEPVQSMLEMLLQMQELEDSILAQQVAVARG